MYKKIIVEEMLKEKIRIDKYLSSNLHLKDLKLSRNQIQKNIELGNIKVNGQKVSSKYIVNFNDIIEILIENEEIEVTKKDEELLLSSIIFEDEDILVINKPKGLIVHSSSEKELTLQKILIKMYNNLPGEEGRKGIVHRLDKDTSGILVIAKTNEAFLNLKTQFKNRKVIKKYKAIIKGNLNISKDDELLIDKPIGRDLKNRHKMKVDYINGKKAITIIKSIAKYDGYEYLDIEIKTGRTHQIRVHLSNMGKYILGDNIYTDKISKKKNKFGINGQILQSYYINFMHPKTNENLIFKLEESDEIKAVLSKLK